MPLHTLTTGPLAGFLVADIDLGKLAEFKQACYDAGVRYGFGAKDPHPGSGKVDFKEIDCSGYIRTLLRYACPDEFDAMPDGSYMEDVYFDDLRDHLTGKGFKRTDYANCALSDGHVRLCFHKPGGRGGDPIGHVWLCINGHTVESYGGHGPGERPWDHAWHVEHVDDCYVIG